MSARNPSTPGQLTPVQLTISTTNAATDLINNSYLTYLVPAETNIDLEKALEGFDSSKTVSELIEQRDTLFFDETVDVLLVLKTPWLPRKELDYHLSRISISLEAQVANGSVPGRDSPNSSESIFSGRLKETKKPFVIEDKREYGSDVEDEEEEEEPRFVYAMWKLPVLLIRPRMRLHSPAVVFSASASLDPDLWTEPVAPDVGYLPSGLPSGFNLLESFSNDFALNGVKPRLSALRVSRVAPVTRQQDFMTRLRTLPQLSIKVFPVLHTRIRFSRPNTIPLSRSIVALLEIDFTSHFECEALLNSIRLTSPNGTVENLNDEAGLSLPLSCVSHDHITLLYHIQPQQTETTLPRDTSGSLEISIAASVLVIPGVCTPSLTMSWTTALDFSLPVNPSFGTASESGIQRAHRPTQLSIGSVAQVITHLKSPSAIRPDALPTLEASTNRTEASIPDLGITMSFTAPSTPVHPGDIFSWTVYVVNRSSDKANNTRPPRKLALVAVPKRRRAEVRPIRPPSSSGRRRGDKEIADAVLDENVIHALQKSATLETSELICLSADTRVGPVAPGACHVVELQFLALQEGVVGLEAIRVVDLGSQEHVDIGDLPTMIVEPLAAAA
ncbi:TRAPP trafficking subunit trs65 domain-containing protein [Trichoderma breve]|uniref:TRAPP trafficking subunit trs65 domain-containing protein n=1 Tax=Trichoderma breve TaxID=2034170 RepID=A0A9W9E832_9HYPO|nr:TRAPP trafficking subunit trs65 domain-containing protein [Trichoderma breve]KAJ4861065.1 TRAPP trafficking subunit trs65 domain-containing protein [Trichoderma breve]